MNEKQSLIKMMFPDGDISGRGGDEVNGLHENTIPKGVILYKAQRPPEKDRTFYLVEFYGELFYLRVCKAMKGSEYDEFAVIIDSSFETAKDDMVKYFKRVYAENIT